MTDDEITDRLSTEIADRVQASHPAATPGHRRELVRAYCRQLLGEPLSLKDVGAILGESPQRIHEIETRALARAWRTYHRDFPHLLTSDP
jgi:DNA-directed RNA polymerase sigma subunit (sigma70/sigma32)